MQQIADVTGASVTAGLLSRAEIASTLKRTERTLIRWEQAGMPVIRVGHLRLYNPSAVRGWLMAHESRPPAPPRSPGRPRKAA